jgi:hypothetical protein
MPMNDDFAPDHHLPLFLSRHVDEPDVGRAWDIATISSRILRVGLLVVTASAIGFVLADDPVALFASVKASLFDASALHASEQSTAVIQSTSDAQELPPTAADAPTREEIAAAFAAAHQRLAQNAEPPAEALLKQFQAWAAKEDAQAPVMREQPVQAAREDAQPPVKSVPPVQDTPTQAAEDAPAPVRHMARHRHVRPVQNARAEMRQQYSRRLVRREQTARVQGPPVQDPRAQAQDQAAQNAQSPSFLQSLGLQR